MLYEDENEAVDSSAAASSEPTANTETSSQQPASPPPVFHPLAYRSVVANWPIEWREQWGERANSLEEGGLSWRDAETQAFVEIWNLLRNHAPKQSSEPVPSATAERN
jgi:hypothetical protein